jgi:hypothetical protein
VVRGLALLLLVAFALLRLEPARLDLAHHTSTIQHAKVPELPSYSIERSSTRTSSVTLPHAPGLKATGFHHTFAVTRAPSSTVHVSRPPTVHRLIDRRALIRRLGRVQHRSPAPSA